MSVLRRNITGHDILAIREYIDKNSPTTEDEILRRFFPGDATDSSVSDKLKLIRDAVGFLEDIDQIVEETDGYRLHQDSVEAVDPRSSILSSLHSQFGENGAYNDVLEYLAEENQTLVTREGGLEDAMSGYTPEIGWNPTNLSYWERTMDCLGVITKVHEDDATMAFVLEYDLWKQILNEIRETQTTQLERILSSLDDTYLPVWTAGGSVAKHVQYGLTGLEDRSEIDLRKESDAGTTYQIGSRGVNTIECDTDF
jgi:hypothetical protein